MRIIAGKFAKRRLHTLNSMATRPTSDKVKESLFNSLGQFFAGGDVLDLYAGSGALGLESLSRGFSQAVFVDRSQAACRVIRKNIALCGAGSSCWVLPVSAQKAVEILAKKGKSFQLVFLDPPYAKEKIARDMKELARLDLAARGSLVVAETDRSVSLPHVAGYRRLKQNRLGRTIINIYLRQQDDKSNDTGQL